MYTVRYTHISYVSINAHRNVDLRPATWIAYTSVQICKEYVNNREWLDMYEIYRGFYLSFLQGG